ncbi:sensor histidine kinase [Aeoliella mucimassa]|uniref:histidine kinase n=1 Tax=Aeoliella mucimassa TaxID=2527972 RepID=A0A518AI48_9BACT|nr:ATP-binding protein [Aeoliella mucimassa]QDU54403.1 Wide host range VirA protein [Aeoliella mucimassa]
MHSGDSVTASELQQQVKLLQEELRESQSMAALGELASTTTHEFNNVLTTILNYAKLGLRHKDEPTRTKALEKIMGAAERANKITNSVLGLARNRSNDPAPTNLSELIDETLVLLERELSKYRVAVQREFAEVPKAMVIGNQIQQVLLNLLTNARQAMPNGGQVLIKLSHEPEAPLVELTVRDTGSGIDAASLPKIFERGFSTKRGPDESGKGGAGLGLAACREIVEAHGGRIRVASTVGRGTAFTLRLPVASEAASNPTSQPVVALGV